MAVANKGRRSYDATGRRERAARHRDAVLERARELFLADGYSSTTVALIAAAAGVSAETVYKSFGGKPGIVRAIFERSLLGSAAEPAERRSDLAQETAVDARSLFRIFGGFSAEVAPLTAPIIGLIRAASAAGDPEMTALLSEVEEKRHVRMRHNAEVLAARGFLGPGVSVMRAADVMWLYTADDVFASLVMRRGWTHEQYGDFIADALAAALSAPP
jgi:AcrR family transcriptional regulator